MESYEVSSEEQNLQQATAVVYAESLMNLTLVDPPRWGWTAGGTIADLLPPHERSRRRGTSLAFRKLKRKRAPTPSRQEKDVPLSSLKEAPEVASTTSKIITPVIESTAQTTQRVSLEESELGETQNAASSTDKIKYSNSDQMEADSTKVKDATITGSGETQQSRESVAEEQGGSAAEESADPCSNAVPQKAQPLPTLKLLGFKSKYLGMTVTKVPTPENGTKNRNEVRGAASRRSNFECEVEAQNSDGVLDMYSYHRGREGFEPRDPESGELRCPLPATDTNHNYDSPRLSCNVTIEFPLKDSGTSDQKLAMYSETLSWDLSDPSTPSPLMFAHAIANEFGLKYGQMLDLACNIEAQVEMHVQQSLSYFPPISTEDPTGMERQNVGKCVQTHRYGQVSQLGPGGTILASEERQRVAQVNRIALRPPSTTGSTSAKRKERSRVLDEAFDDNIEDKYLHEVQRRSRDESILEINNKCNNGIVGLLERNDNILCHICHKKCNVAFSFACGITTHTYCELHCKTRLEGAFNSQQPISAFCPVCTLICRCSRCVRKLKTVAGFLKEAMEAQGTTLEDTQYDNILSKCRSVVGNAKLANPGLNLKRRHSNASPVNTDTLSSTKTGSQARTTKRVGASSGVEASKRLVPKPPLTDFPREISGSIELEPGTPDDYLRVYTSQGSYLSDDFPQVWAEQQSKRTESDPSALSNGELVEDGNVDFCQICQNHGNLVCCDFCPRSFHVDCLEDGGHSISEDRWECISCQLEKEDMPEDLVDAAKSKELILSSFGGKAEIDKESKEIEALSAIHAMLVTLMDYDFGYMFSVPVDVETVPTYRDTVETPMDLGTICEKLLNGGYDDVLSNGGTWDNVLVAVLQDVELVWHNCFLFNFDGSAIYRMATVQRRRALAIQKKCFDHLLSDRVKLEVFQFVRSCEEKRGQLTTSLPANLVGNKEKELRCRKPKGKHKITVKVAKPSANRPVAIFDHVTGRIVKIYSSIRSANHAAHSLLSLGYRCEWPSAQDLVKQVVSRSASDPSIFLFGYRWLMLDDLRDGKVNFHRPPLEGIQLLHSGSLYTFLSVDEALSFPFLVKTERIDHLRKQLTTLQRGDEWTNIGGVMWRWLASPEDGSLQVDGKIAPSATGNLENAVSKTEASFLAESVVIKVDLITKRTLIGFGSVKDAFLDWMQTAEFSPSFPPLEARSMENFKEYYLDGDRNVDGLTWKSRPISSVESTFAIKKDSQASVPVINGIALSPLVRSSDKKRSQRNELMMDGMDDHKSKKMRVDSAYSSAERPANNAPLNEEINPGTPLLGIQLFRNSPKPDQQITRDDGPVSRSPSNVRI